MAVEMTPKCECRVAYAKLTAYSACEPVVVHCPLHAAADAMYEALKRVLANHYDPVDGSLRKWRDLPLKPGTYVMDVGLDALALAEKGNADDA